MNFNLIFVIFIISGQLIKILTGFTFLNLIDFAIFNYVLITLIKNNQSFIKSPLAFKLAFGLFWIMLISLFLTPLDLFINQYLISISYSLRFLFYILFGWLVIGQIIKKTYFLKINYYSGIILAFLGILQIIIYPDISTFQKFGFDPHFYRAVSTFFDPNFLGAYLSLSLLYNLVYFKKKPLHITFFILIFLCIVLTFSRSSILMFFTCLLILSYLKKSLRLVLVSLSLTVILIFGYFMYQQFIGQPKNIDRNSSADSRIKSWIVGFELIKKNPLFGTGYNTYQYAINHYQLVPNGYKISGNDSSLIHITATTGIIGLIFFCLFLGNLMLNNFKKRSLQDNQIYLAGMVGLLIHSLFLNSLFYPPILLWIIGNINEN